LCGKGKRLYEAGFVNGRVGIIIGIEALVTFSVVTERKGKSVEQKYEFTLGHTQAR
jgi:hypothetical protein